MAGNNDTTQPGDEHVPLQENAPSDVQVALVQIMQRIDGMFMGDGSLGSTNFENYSLEELTAFTQGGDPARLTTAGEDLYKAGKAFETAADTLKGKLANVEWEGAAGASFQAWSTNFVGRTFELSEYAATAGTQIQAAGIGLSEVKRSMPENYTDKADSWSRADQKSDPELYQDTIRADSAERNRRRQEAITQMNKLASHYSVASSTLGGLKPPVYEPINAAVPAPNWDGVDSGGGGARSSVTSVDRSSSTGHPRAVGPTVPDAPTAGTVDTKPGLIPGHLPSPGTPDAPVGTDLDSVVVPTAPTPTAPGPGQLGPITPTPGPGPSLSGPTPGYMPPPKMPVGPGPGLPPGPGRMPTTQLGGPKPPQTGTGPIRPGGKPVTPTLGRGPGPMGPNATGPKGTGPAGGRTPTIGRGPTGTGPTGQGANRGQGLTPRTGGGPRGLQGGPRSNVVGGKPTGTGPSRGMPGGGRPGTIGRPSPAGAGSSRLPRGTVVGGEGVSSERGVTRGAARGGASEGRGVVGNGRGGGQRGFTRGGAGLGGRRNENGNDPEQMDSERADYLVEDEETWAAGESGPRVVE
ncbi:hypothetical protein SRB5_63730 [Streptomyces sp. RB5]|uniref:Uncharacterized protein n=1 Tax=Streptomyces smaragdinus TaxID=2585196 RepID=A0A7K0CRR2_9ACTN|nr:hypothetical protein [Streptomyces smaragdinus]MQY16177.1 hypothetical protein [Streptomyces smaragdinus]